MKLLIKECKNCKTIVLAKNSCHKCSCLEYRTLKEQPIKIEYHPKEGIFIKRLKDL